MVSNKRKGAIVWHDAFDKEDKVRNLLDPDKTRKLMLQHVG